MVPASETLDNSFEKEALTEVDYIAQADIRKKMAEREQMMKDLGDLTQVFDQLKS